jgi:hypothetical protein
MFEITTRPPNTFLFNNSTNIVNNSPYHRPEQNQVDSDFKNLRRNQSALNSINNPLKPRSSSSIAVINNTGLLKPMNANGGSISINTPPQSQISSNNSNLFPPPSPNLNYTYYNRQNLNRIQINHNGTGNLLNRPVMSSNSHFSKTNDLNLLTNAELNR